MRFLIVATGLAAVLTAARATLSAQAPASRPPTFEVASIKVNTSGTLRTSTYGLQPGGRYTVVNWTIRGLLQQAFHVQDFQLVGGPDWLDKDRFDVTAKADRQFTSAQVPAMLQALLRDRLQLRVHTEVRNLSLYTLALDRRDRKLGPRMHASGVDCGAQLASGVPPPPPENGKVPPCGMETRGGRHLIANGVTMPQLANLLSFPTHATVVDHTELTGSFDIDLEWTPDQALPGAEGLTPAPDAISIFTAIKEQLGLKLEPHKGPVDVTVIDHIEKPTPD